MMILVMLKWLVVKVVGVSSLTSNATLIAVEAGWCRVTEDIVPVPDKMHKARCLSCENACNFATMS